ncbi:alpha-glucosidase [Roseburia sp. OM04-10BH]|uniref:glycoside hydrolase family 13 protein n=1 Tax=unclassified Roseburia TaxID=2637578 RepID=UPI000E4A23A8|nr:MULTISPECIES: alpha-glucosidase [unclassified Roseburia]RGI43234.1 alpha-glucosidase [Roseburia sp. OM04-10BH]RHV39574.1 alpha-glucosidase [Roseburia sp. OM04-15AA]RHV59994.1 alpha-glucosidase [Roseburia sp. OM04-10AA]
MSNNVTEKKWWQSAVVYQIYPKSFQDSNGDGVGDLRGIMERLEYLGKLGIDAIWLSPVCKSPQADNGYDISDYQDIDPMFGSVEDMEALIKEAKKYNIRIIMDLVLNHTSNKHRWFEEAKKSKDNPYHDYYVWRDGEEGVEPNDMKAVFGGSAWEWVPEIKQYYFHQFLPEQPDLNWENPQVRKEIYDMILWWMEKGVGGFRLDVIDQIAKEPDKKITINGPRLHEYFREMSKETFQKGDLITVGEAWGADPERAKLYSNPDGSEFSMVFQFEHIGLDQQEGKDKWDLAPLPFLKLKQIMNLWQTELYNCGWNSLFWDNHDLPRIVSRWGNDKEYRVESAKMLAILLHGMQGTPYIFEGEELGMTNVRYNIEDYRDVEIQNVYKERIAAGYDKEDVMNSIYAKGRDNARTPMQWDDTENAGFTTGTPWIKVNDNYKTINAKSQVDDPDSIFNCYRKLVSFRKEYPVLVDGSFKLLLAEDENIFAYERKNADETLLVVCNFYGNTVKMPLTEETEDMELLISNYKETEDSSVLRPYEARMYYKK